MLRKNLTASKKFSLLVCLCWLAACSYKIPKDPYAVIQDLGTDPDRLNPIISNSAYAATVTGYIFERLVDLDNQTVLPKPMLALSWETTTDHLTYTFHLRKDVKWHDGEPFTAEDVLFTYRQIKNPKVDAGPSRNYFIDIIGCEILDLYTVRFQLQKPYIGALTTIGLMSIIPKHVFGNVSAKNFNGHSFNRRPVGTGPFRFVEWKTGQRIVLKKNDNYWGKPYNIQRMIFHIIPDELVRFQLFKKGSLDLVELNPLQWARQTDSEKFKKQFVKHRIFSRFGVYSYLGWNLRKSLFKDKRVRLALAHLVDRKAINEKLLFGLYMPVTGPYYPLGRNYDTSLEPIEYDLEKAKALLEEAGWKDENGDGLRDKDGKTFRFTLIFSAGVQYYEQLTPILRENFKRAGVELDLRRLEGAALFKTMREHGFDAYLAAWSRGAGEEDIYQIWHSSQADVGSNYIGYHNSKVDRLLEEGRQEFDVQKRETLYKEVHRQIYHDQPYLFFFARPDLFARDSRFKNVKEYPIGLDMREWKVED